MNSQNTTQVLLQKRQHNSPRVEWVTQRRPKTQPDKQSMEDTADSIMPYIILLDNFMGPILKRMALKAVNFNFQRPPSSSLSCDLPQLGLFYADLLGERRGTATAEWHTSDTGGETWDERKWHRDRDS